MTIADILSIAGLGEEQDEGDWFLNDVLLWQVLIAARGLVKPTVSNETSETILSQFLKCLSRYSDACRFFSFSQLAALYRPHIFDLHHYPDMAEPMQKMVEEGDWDIISPGCDKVIAIVTPTHPPSAWDLLQALTIGLEKPGVHVDFEALRPLKEHPLLEFEPFHLEKLEQELGINVSRLKKDDLSERICTILEAFFRKAATQSNVDEYVTRVSHWNVLVAFHDVPRRQSWEGDGNGQGARGITSFDSCSDAAPCGLENVGRSDETEESSL